MAAEKKKKVRKKPTLASDPLAYTGDLDELTDKGRNAKLDIPLDRKKMLISLVAQGLSQSTAADQVGMSPSALMAYKVSHPDFARELNAAYAAQICEANSILRNLMKGATQEAVQLKAVTYYLSHRAEEYQEKKEDTGFDSDPDASYL